MPNMIRLDDVCSGFYERQQASNKLNDALVIPVGKMSEWKPQVASALESLSVEINKSMDRLTKPDGLVEHIQTSFPHLARRVLEHQVDLERIEKSIGALSESIFNLKTYQMALSLRVQIVELLGQISLYNQREADLLFDTYRLDVAERKILSTQKEVIELS